LWHPLLRRTEGQARRLSSGRQTAPLQLPLPDGPVSWNAIDEVIHRAFRDGVATDISQKVGLAELVARVRGPLRGPGVSEDEGWHGQSRGLARAERLVPRPFYLDESLLPRSGDGAPAEERAGAAEPPDATAEGARPTSKFAGPRRARLGPLRTEPERAESDAERPRTGGRGEGDAERPRPGDFLV